MLCTNSPKRMSHLLFDPLTGETFDNQTSFTVQSIFDTNSYATDSITFDDDDVFQCGRCKKQFTTLSIFMQHKKENSCNIGGPLPVSLNPQNETVHELPNASMPIHQEELNTPLILNDADILSLTAYESQEGELSDLGEHLVATHEDLPVDPLETSINISQFGNNPQIIFTTPELPLGNFQPNNNKKMKNNDVNLNDCQVILQNADIMNTERLEYIEPDKMLAKGYEVIVEDIVNGNVTECLNTVDTTNTYQLLQINPTENIDNENLLGNQTNLVTQIEIINPNDPTITSILNPIDFNYKQNLDNSINPTSGNTMETLLPAKKNKKTKEPTKLVKCDYCNKEFSKNFDLRQHIRSHTGEKPFQCIICGRAFAQKSNVRKHLNTHKVLPEPVTKTLPKEANTPEIENQNPEVSLNEVESFDMMNKETLPQERYACQYCPKQFIHYFDLKKHLKDHENIKVFQCFQKNCHQVFPDLSSLLEHGACHSSDLTYRCFDCGEEFKSLEDLGVHQYTHMAPKKRNRRLPKKYVCIKCKSKFVSPEALERHISKSTHDYRCAKCGRIFLCERFLRRHLLSHASYFSHSCTECHKNFRTAKSLKLHMKLHRGEKDFHCKKCNASFIRNDQLTRHMLVHEAVKRFKCPYKVPLGCNREFNRQDKLKHHIRSHIIPCSQCNRTFSRSVLLRHHENFVHNGKKCIYCDQIFQSVHLCTVQHPMHRRLARNNRRNNKNNKNANPNDPKTSNARNTDSNKTDELQYLNVETMNEEDDQVLQDDVPTIEIIVMPMPSEDENMNKNPYPTILQPSENHF